MVDDHSRVAYAEIHDDEKAITAAGVLRRAVAWFAARNVHVTRVISDNGSCYRSTLWQQTCAQLGITPKWTRPYRPQTNGKIERFHRTLTDGWVYARCYQSENERSNALGQWLHDYNHHRPHSACAGQPPITLISTIVAWFGTFIVNVPLAQAAFQMSMSARTLEDGQRGLFLAAVIGAPLIVLGVVVGIASAAVVPSDGKPLIAISEYVVGAVPPWAAAIFFVGLWACALGWAGPCQFSGATSLGRDLSGALNPRASQQQLVFYSRAALGGLTVLLIIFSLLRAEESAWWNIMAWTLRNGATFAPVLAAFFWPVATKTAAVVSMLAGFGTGLAWYALSGFDASELFLGTHPVWPGMIANMVSLVLISLAQRNWRLTFDSRRRNRGALAVCASAVVAVQLVLSWAWARDHGLVGLGVFLIVLGLFAAALLLAVPCTGQAKTAEPSLVKKNHGNVWA